MPLHAVPEGELRDCSFCCRPKIFPRPAPGPRTRDDGSRRYGRLFSPVGFLDPVGVPGGQSLLAFFMLGRVG